MLYLLLTTIMLIVIFQGLGQLYFLLFSFQKEKISLTILAGFTITAGLWSALAFFSPINQVVEIAFSAIGVISFIYFKSYLILYRFFKSKDSIFYILVVLVLIVGSYHPYILDHFGYYIPTISWIKNFGIIKGISNLDMLLGQYSTWHILQAGISNYIDPFLRLNTVLIVVFTIYIYEKKFWSGLLLIPILFLFAQSPSTELPILVIAIIVINEIFTFSKNAKFLFLLSCFAMTIKPTVFWIVLFVGIYFEVYKKINWKISFFGFLFLLLFVLKNIWTFGFPIFPIGFPDLGLSWQPNAQLLELSKETGKELSYNLQYSYWEINNFSRKEMVVNWLKLGGIKGLMNILLIITIITFSIYAFIKKSKILIILISCLLVKVIIVLITSSQYRLYIDIFFIAFIIYLPRMSIFWAKALSIILSIVAILIMSFPLFLQKTIPSFYLGNTMQGFSRHQMITPSQYKIKKYKTYKIGNLTFNIIKDYQFSFDTPPPAISPSYLLEYYRLGIFPQHVGKNIKSGFIWKTLTPKEKMKLQYIIYDIDND